MFFHQSHLFLLIEEKPPARLRHTELRIGMHQIPLPIETNQNIKSSDFLGTILWISGATQPASQPREASQAGNQEAWLTGCLAGRPNKRTTTTNKIQNMGKI